LRSLRSRRSLAHLHLDAAVDARVEHVAVGAEEHVEPLEDVHEDLVLIALALRAGGEGDGLVDRGGGGGLAGGGGGGLGGGGGGAVGTGVLYTNVLRFSVVVTCGYP
jgi:hypothetical protein